MASLTHFTDEENQRIIELYNNNEKYMVICYELNKTEKQILNQIKRLGLKPRYHNRKQYFVEINSNGTQIKSSKKFNVWLKQSSYEKLYKHARNSNLSVSEYVRMILEEKLATMMEDTTA